MLMETSLYADPKALYITGTERVCKGSNGQLPNIESHFNSRDKTSLSPSTTNRENLPIPVRIRRHRHTGLCSFGKMDLTALYYDPASSIVFALLPTQYQQLLFSSLMSTGLLAFPESPRTITKFSLQYRKNPMALKQIFSIYVAATTLRCTWCRPASICNESNCTSYPQRDIPPSPQRGRHPPCMHLSAICVTKSHVPRERFLCSGHVTGDVTSRPLSSLLVPVPYKGLKCPQHRVWKLDC